MTGDARVGLEQRSGAPQVRRGDRGDQPDGALGGVEGERFDAELQARPRPESVLARDRELGQRDRWELACLAAALGLVAQVAEVRAGREKPRWVGWPCVL